VARHSDPSLKSDSQDGIPGFPMELIIFTLANDPGFSIYSIFKIKIISKLNFSYSKSSFNFFSNVWIIKLKS